MGHLFTVYSHRKGGCREVERREGGKEERKQSREGGRGWDLEIPAIRCSLVDFKGQPRSSRKQCLFSINFNIDKIRKSFLTVFFLKCLNKLRRKRCQTLIKFKLLLITPSKILHFSSSWFELSYDEQGSHSVNFVPSRHLCRHVDF